MMPLTHETGMWTGFAVLMILALAFDLGVFQKKASEADEEVSFKSALLNTLLWVSLALGFFTYLWFFEGHQRGLEFLTGYLVEQSLSLDNIFVFIMIFNYFHVSSRFQRKILFWGILSAVVFRLVFIFLGVALLERFHWIMYILGAFLVYTGGKMFIEKKEDASDDFKPENNLLVRWAKKCLPFTDQVYDGQFFVKHQGHWLATPMLMVLMVVETTDIMFAADSIPAILSISRDMFVVYTSNIFAILGLRSMYFMLKSLIEKFHYLHYGIGFILAFVGLKMLFDSVIEVPILITLLVIFMTIVVTILLSLKNKPEE